MTGGKARLACITRQGDDDLQTLLIQGARSAVMSAGQGGDRISQWLLQLKERVGWQEDRRGEKGRASPPSSACKAAHWQQVNSVTQTFAARAVIVVGLRAHPCPAKPRRLLTAAGIAHHCLEYGGYLSEWRRRNALKLWTGWPTFPMVFVRGTLVGGFDDLKRLHDSGELKRMLG